MKTLLRQYTSYNLWANTQFGILMRDLDPALLDKELASSFPSLRKTVHHIWDAELSWLSRMKNQVVAWPPSAQFKDPAIDAFVNGSKAFDEFVGLEDEDFLKGITTYKNTKGKEFSNPNSGIIMHCMNHSTFHRGQLVTMLRMLGLDKIPATDLIAFLRDLKSA
jgi:uncharacterized damage-inducible protein DinB